MLLSDGTAAAEVPVAWQLVKKLGLPIPAEDGPGGIQPVGDLSLFNDLGLNAMELGALCDDLELYPDEMLSSIASRLGFGEPFRRAVDAALS
jgi:putative tRNA adenosine deaminase-associated protein